LAVFAQRIPVSVDLLAATEAAGGRRCLAPRLAYIAGTLDAKGLLIWDEAFLDGSSAPVKKVGLAVGKTKRGKGTKWMVLGDGDGVPLGVRLERVSPAEVTLADATLTEVRVPRPKGRQRQKPKRVIADRGYDSDPLRQRWKRRGIELIAPYRSNNKERKYEDGRKLRRNKRRWKIARTNDWLGQFRRLLVRHEHLLVTYRAFFYLACLWFALRKCL
jgi:transposase